MLTGSHRKLNPQRPVVRRQPRVTSRLNSTVAANSYCARAPAQHHRTLYCVTPDASGAHQTHAQRAPQTRRVTGREPPDAPWASGAHRSETSRAHSLTSHTTGRSNGNRPASGASIRCALHTWTTDTTPDALDQRPVLPTPASGESCNFSKFPTGAIENMHLIFSKASNVPTPPSVHHHVQVC